MERVLASASCGFVQDSTTFNGGFCSRRRQKEKAPGRMSFPRGLASLAHRGVTRPADELCRTATFGVPWLEGRSHSLTNLDMAPSSSHYVLMAAQGAGRV